MKFEVPPLVEVVDSWADTFPMNVCIAKLSPPTDGIKSIWSVLNVTYEEFVKVYNEHKISVEHIKKIFGRAKYDRYRKQGLKQGDITQRPHSLKFGKDDFGVKHYHYDKQRQQYRVRKVIKGKYHSYGFYDKEEDAQKVVAILKKYDWDKTKLTEKEKKIICLTG